MVVRTFGVEVSGKELFTKLRTDRSGTRQTALVHSLRDLGVRVRLRYDMSFAHLRGAVDRGKLVIGYLHDAEHWLVLYGYSETPRRVYVADPRPQTVCEQEWDTYEERLGGFGMVCSVPDNRLSKRRGPPSDAADDLADFGRQLTLSLH